MVKNNNHGYLVLGAFHAGTSLVAHALSELGVNFGPKDELVQPTAYHAGNYFERHDINDINSSLIVSASQGLCNPVDAQAIAEKSQKSLFKVDHMSWITQEQSWGLKDPRFCVTLASWFKHGVINPANVTIIYVRRNIEDTVRSALTNPIISRYCNGSRIEMQKMIEHYNAMARWHIEHFNLPYYEVRYPELHLDHVSVVKNLAGYLDLHDFRLIKRVSNIIGRQLPLKRSLPYRIFVKWPVKILRKIMFLDGNHRGY